MTHMDVLHRLMELTATESISHKQEQAWMRLLEGFAVETCAAAAEVVGLASKGMPEFDRFRRHCREHGQAPRTRPVQRWWGTDGTWGGDWSGQSHRSLVKHFALIARYATPRNAEHVAEFKRLCLSRGIPVPTLDGALAAARTSDYELEVFVRRMEAVAA